MDRLAISVHPPTAARAEVGEEADRLGIARGGALISHRTLWLAGEVSRAELASIVRYADPTFLSAALYSGVQEGILDGADGVYRASANAIEWLRAVTAIQGDVMDHLWGDHADDVEVLRGLAATVIDGAGADPDDHPAYSAMRRALDTEGKSPAHALLEQVTVLRYFRADAHALALSEAGLPTDHQTAERLAALGPDERAAIEDATDRYAAPPWATLTDAQRDEFLAAARRLPG